MVRSLRTSAFSLLRPVGRTAVPLVRAVASLKTADLPLVSFDAWIRDWADVAETLLREPVELRPAGDGSGPESDLPDAGLRDEANLARVLERVLAPQSNCIDVGCNLGSVLRYMLRIAPKGEHWAFEPIPRLAWRLRFRFPQVHVVQAALSHRAGTSEFQFVVNDPGYSGLRQRKYDRPDPEIRPICVRTVRLDDVVPRDRHIAFVKVDVEGGEFDVFRGGVETLRAHRPFVAFEHGKGSADRYGATPGGVWDLLTADLDLGITSLHGWLRGEAPLTRDAFCEVFERSTYWNFLAAPRPP